MCSRPLNADRSVTWVLRKFRSRRLGRAARQDTFSTAVPYSQTDSRVGMEARGDTSVTWVALRTSFFRRVRPASGVRSRTAVSTADRDSRLGQSARGDRSLKSGF